MKFKKSQIAKQELNIFIPGGPDALIEFAYATPIGPKLKALSEEKQNEFKQKYVENLKVLLQPDGSVGKMATNVLHLEK